MASGSPLAPGRQLRRSALVRLDGSGPDCWPEGSLRSLHGRPLQCDPERKTFYRTAVFGKLSSLDCSPGCFRGRLSLPPLWGGGLLPSRPETLPPPSQNLPKSWPQTPAPDRSQHAAGRLFPLAQVTRRPPSGRISSSSLSAADGSNCGKRLAHSTARRLPGSSRSSSHPSSTIS